MRRRKSDTREAGEAEGIRVLIVDDDEPYRVFMRALVRRLGCSAETAGDGAEALEKLKTKTFDLLLSDLQMPKLNGLELIRCVRAHPSVSAIYAVLITSREDPKFKVEALTLGYDDFLPKSCADVEVKARIESARRMLARQRAADAETARWRLLASRDELTNVGTRRTFTESTRAVLAEGRVVAVVMLDLDDFKQVNDVHGHLVGDRILREVGALLLGRTRSEDVIARYGGDEFVLLVPDATSEEAVAIASRLESDLAQLSWLVGTETLHVHATTGIAHSTLLAAPAVEQLLEAADRDLYAKKWLRKHPPVTPETHYAYGENNAEIHDTSPKASEPSSRTRRARVR